VITVLGSPTSLSFEGFRNWIEAVIVRFEEQPDEEEEEEETKREEACNAAINFLVFFKMYVCNGFERIA